MRTLSPLAIPSDAGKCCRQCGDDDERIGPRLEVHDNPQVDKHNCAKQAEQQARERIFHRAYLAKQ